MDRRGEEGRGEEEGERVDREIEMGITKGEVAEVGRRNRIF